MVRLGSGLVQLFHRVVRCLFRAAGPKIMHNTKRGGLTLRVLNSDVQVMLGGSHKLAIGLDEYVFAALNLYLDVVNLFLMILGLFGNSR
jgi:FtsH-binding integral membrane protein